MNNNCWPWTTGSKQERRKERVTEATWASSLRPQLHLPPASPLVASLRWTSPPPNGNNKTAPPAPQSTSATKSTMASNGQPWQKKSGEEPTEDAIFVVNPATPSSPAPRNNPAHDILCMVQQPPYNPTTPLAAHPPPPHRHLSNSNSMHLPPHQRVFNNS